MQRPGYNTKCTDPFISLHSPHICETDLKILKLLYLRKDLSFKCKWTSHLFPLENHGLRIAGADCHPSSSAANYSQCMLGVLEEWSPENHSIHVIYRKLGGNLLFNKSDPLQALAVPRKAVHNGYKQMFYLPLGFCIATWFK